MPCSTNGSLKFSTRPTSLSRIVCTFVNAGFASRWTGVNVVCGSANGAPRYSQRSSLL